MSGGGREQARTMLPSQELLDDLCSRFVLNVPEEDRQSFERLLFLIEAAHWFYEDNAMEQNHSLKSLNLREFTSLMFQSCAALRPYLGHIDNIYKDFTTYKIRVPVTGAIILDETFERCLLVKGWKPGASWMFPRGKKSKDEEDHICAAREVLEETGYDVSGLLKVDEYLEMHLGQQRMRLYIIPSVKEDTVFAPQTKKEISEIAWHRIDELPAANDQQSHNRGPNGMKYHMVFPFVNGLNNWIDDHHESALHQDPDAPRKGVTVWKVNHNLGANAPVSGGITAHSVGGSMVPHNLRANAPVNGGISMHSMNGAMVTQPPQPPQPTEVPPDTSHQLEFRQNPFKSPSLVNFKFNRGDILRRLAV